MSTVEIQIPESLQQGIAVEAELIAYDPVSPPWSAEVLVFLCGMLAFLNLYSTQPMLPMLAKLFHVSEGSVGMTVSAATLGVAISSMLMGLLAERVSRKTVITTAAFLIVAPTLLAATSSSVAELCFWRLLQGLLLPGIFVATIAYITEEWPALKVPEVMSVYVAGTVFGGYTGRALGGSLESRWGWQSSFIVLGLLALAGAVTLWLLLPPSHVRPVDAGAEIRSRLTPILENLRNPKLIASFGIGFTMLFTLVAMFTYITFRLAATPYCLSSKAMGNLFAVYIIGLIATMVVGRFLSRIGLRMGMLGAIVLAIVGTLTTLLPSLAMIAVGLALVSCGVFISQTCANSFLRDIAAPDGRVSAVGLYIMFYYIGGTVGGVLPAMAWRHAGWQGCAALVTGLLAMAFFIAYFGWRRPAYPIPL